MSKRKFIGGSAELEKRLVAYTAAGAAVLAVGSTPTQGEVVYTKVQTLCNPGADTSALEHLYTSPPHSGDGTKRGRRTDSNSVP